MDSIVFTLQYLDRQTDSIDQYLNKTSDQGLHCLSLIVIGFVAQK